MSSNHEFAQTNFEPQKAHGDLAHFNNASAHEALIKETQHHTGKDNQHLSKNSDHLLHHTHQHQQHHHHHEQSNQHHHGMHRSHDTNHNLSQIDFSKHQIYGSDSRSSGAPQASKQVESHSTGDNDNGGTPRSGSSWMASHEALAQKAKQTKADTVFYGDSITAGMPVSSGKFGINSDSSDNLKYRLNHGEADLAAQPKNAVLHIGINDLGRKSPKDIADNILADAKLLHQKLPDSKILVVGLMSRPGFDKEISEINGILKDKIASSDDPQLKFADIRQSMSGLYRDGIHPTYPDPKNPHAASGYTQMLSSIKNALR